MISSCLIAMSTALYYSRKSRLLSLADAAMALNSESKSRMIDKERRDVDSTVSTSHAKEYRCDSMSQLLGKA